MTMVLMHVEMSLVLINIDRVDPGDRGSEYRSLLGLPGGVNHVSYQEVESASKAAGFQLVEGKLTF